MGLSPAWSFTAELAQPYPGTSRADAVSAVPSACISVRLTASALSLAFLLASSRAALRPRGRPFTPVAGVTMLRDLPPLMPRAAVSCTAKRDAGETPRHYRRLSRRAPPSHVQRNETPARPCSVTAASHATRQGLRCSETRRRRDAAGPYPYWPCDGAQPYPTHSAGGAILAGLVLSASGLPQRAPGSAKAADRIATLGEQIAGGCAEALPSCPNRKGTPTNATEGVPGTAASAWRQHSMHRETVALSRGAWRQDRP